MKKGICFFLSCLLCFLSFSTISSVYGQGYRKNITGEFSNIQISVNNVPMQLRREPFIYDGEIYVPIKSLSEGLYLSTNYDEINNTIKISTGNLLGDATTRNVAGLLMQKNYENLSLLNEINQEELKLKKERRFPYREVTSSKEMKQYLEDYFSNFRDIPMTISFTNYSGNRYHVYVTFSSIYRQEFDKIPRRAIEEWVENVLSAVRELYDDKARIDGHIRDNASYYRTYLTFDTPGNYINFDFHSHSSNNSKEIDIDDVALQKKLQKNLSSYDGVAFDYKVSSNRYDISLMVYFDGNDFNTWSDARKRNYLNRLHTEIHGFDRHLDTYGKIIDDANGKEVAYFQFINNRVNFYKYEPLDVVSTIQPIEKSKPIETNPVIPKSLTAWFGHMTLEVDGSPFKMLKEPLMIEDEIYLPITDLADAVYWVFEYTPRDNLLKIIDNNFHSNNYGVLGGSMLSQKQQEQGHLLTQLEEVRRKVEQTSNPLLPHRDINTVSKMQTYLNDYFGDFDDVEMSISFTQSIGSSYHLEISYRKEDQEAFNAIRQGSIEAWVEGMLEAVRTFFDLYPSISGYIRSSDYNRSDELPYVSFDMKNHELVFDFENHKNSSSFSQRVDASKLEKVLNKNIGSYWATNLYYEVIVNGKNVELRIYCNNRDLDDLDMYAMMNYLLDLRKEIYEVYNNISINGGIVDNVSMKDIFRFSIEKGAIRSFDLLEDMESYLNKNYKTFTFNDNVLNFTYKIWEKSNGAFDVKLEGDFLQQESQWRNIATDDTSLQKFEDFFIDTLKVISEFWEADVQGEVVDKAYSPLMIKTVSYTR